MSDVYGNPELAADPNANQPIRTGMQTRPGLDARQRYALPNYNPVGPGGRRMGNWDLAGAGFADENIVTMLAIEGAQALGVDDNIADFYGSPQRRSDLRPDFEPETNYNVFRDEQVTNRSDRYSITSLIEGSRSADETRYLLNRMDNPLSERNAIQQSGWYMFGRVAGGFLDATSFVPFAWARGAGRGALALGGMLTAEEMAKQVMDPDRDDMDLLYVAAAGAAFGGVIGRMNYKRSLPGRTNAQEEVFTAVREAPEYRMNNRILSNSGGRQFYDWFKGADPATIRTLEQGDFSIKEWTGVQLGILRRMIDDNGGKLPFANAKDAWEAVRDIQVGAMAQTKQVKFLAEVLRKRGVDAEWVQDFRRVLKQSPTDAKAMLDEVLGDTGKLVKQTGKIWDDFGARVGKKGDELHGKLNDWLRKKVKEAEEAEANALRASDPGLAKMAEDATAKHADLLKSTGKGRLEALADEYPQGASIGSKEMKDWMAKVDAALDDIEAGRTGRQTSGEEIPLSRVMDEAGEAQRKSWMDEYDVQKRIEKAKEILNDLNEELIDLYAKMGMMDPGPGIVAGPGVRKAWWDARVKSAEAKGVNVAGGLGEELGKATRHQGKQTDEILRQMPRHMPVDPTPKWFKGRDLIGMQAAKALGLEHLIDSPVKAILMRSQSPYAKQLVEYLTEIGFWQRKNFAEGKGGFTKTDNAAQLVEEMNARADFLYREMRSDYERYLLSVDQLNPGMIRRVATHDVPILGKNAIDDVTHPIADGVTHLKNQAQGKTILTWDDFSTQVTRYRATRGKIARAGEDLQDSTSMRQLDDYLDSQPGEWGKHVRAAVKRSDEFYQKWADDMHDSGMMYQHRTRYMHRRFAEYSDLKQFHRFMKGEIQEFLDPVDGLAFKAGKDEWTHDNLLNMAKRFMRARWEMRGSMSDEVMDEAWENLSKLWREHEEFIGKNSTREEMKLYPTKQWEELKTKWLNDDEVGEYANAMGKQPTMDELMIASQWLRNLGDEGINMAKDGKLYKYWDEVLELERQTLTETINLRNTNKASPFEREMSDLFTSAHAQKRILDEQMDAARTGALKERARDHIYRLWNTKHIEKNVGEFVDRLMARAKIEDEVTGKFREPTLKEARNFATQAEHTGAMGRQRADEWTMDPRKWFESEGTHKGTSVATTASMRRWRLDEGDFEEFLEFRAHLLSTVYNRNSSPDYVLSKMFGRPDLEPQLAVVRREWMRQARDGKISWKDARKGFARDEKNILAIRDEIRGTYGLPSNPNGRVSRTLRSFKHYNMLTQLTGFLAATGDTAFALGRMGFGHAIAASSMALTNKAQWTAALKQSKGNLMLFGEALDLFSSQRHAKLTNLDHNLGVPQGGEGFLAMLSDVNFRWINMMDQWNTWAKSITGTIAETKYNDLLTRYFDNGFEGMTRMEKAHLRRSFDLENTELMKELSDMLKNASVRGERVATIDPVKAQAQYPAAFAHYGRSITREVRSAIVTPMAGGSPSAIMGEWGSVIFQYWRFVSETYNRILLSGMQQRDMNALGGLVMAVGIGIMIESIRREQLGMDPISKPEEAILAGMERSGVLGYIAQANGILERVSDNDLGLSAMMGVAPPYGTSMRTKVGAVLGPTAATIGNFADVANDIASNKIDHNRAREATAKQIGAMLPFGNVALFSRYTDMLDDLTERGLHHLADARSPAENRYATPQQAATELAAEEEVLTPVDVGRVE